MTHDMMKVEWSEIMLSLCAGTLTQSLLQENGMGPRIGVCITDAAWLQGPNPGPQEDTINCLNAKAH